MAARYSSEPEVLMFFELGWNGVTGGPRNADSAQIKVEMSKQPPSSTGFFSDAAKDARRFKAQEADAVRYAIRAVPQIMLSASHPNPHGAEIR